ncbi:Noranthrone monooxygenase [Beauveria bassiana]|nr:Noranthrone monooxygenase [Beauveria bassiana]KAH8715342.1 Anthrone oxygenase encC [Beauveria bassiana]
MNSSQFTSPVVAVATGIIGSAWASGTIASLSIIGIPTALSTPGSPTVVWNGIFTRGMALMPKVAAVTSLCFLYGAYSSRGQRESKTFLSAAGLGVCIVPFTLVFMAKTNQLLLGSLKATSASSAVETARLISKWGTLNMIRSLFPLAAGILGLWGLYDNR